MLYKPSFDVEWDEKVNMGSTMFVKLAHCIMVEMVVMIVRYADNVYIRNLGERARRWRIPFGAEKGEGTRSFAENGIEEDADSPLRSLHHRRLDEEGCVADPSGAEAIWLVLGPVWTSYFDQLVGALSVGTLGYGNESFFGMVTITCLQNCGQRRFILTGRPWIPEGGWGISHVMSCGRRRVGNA